MHKLGIRYLTYICLGVTILLGSQNKLTAQDDFIYAEFLESNKNIPDDSLASFLYGKSIEYSANDSIDVAIELLYHCKDITQLQNDSLLLGLCLLQIGRLSNDLLKYNNSFSAYNQAYELSIKLRDTNIMIKSMSGIERYYYQLEITDSAIIYCTRAIHINKLRKKYTELTNNYRSLHGYQLYTSGGVVSGTFLIEGLIDSSLMYAKMSEDPSVLCYALTNFALNIVNSDPEKGFEFFYRAIDSARKLPPPSLALSYALIKTGDILIHVNKYIEAEKILQEANEILQKKSDYKQRTHITYLFGDIMFEKDSLMQAINYYTEAVNLAEKYRLNYYHHFIFKRLFKLYLLNEMYDSSYKFQQKYMESFIKKHNREMNLQIARLSAKYQVEQKVEAIDDLTIINNQRKTIIRDQQKFIISLILGIIVVVILFSLLYNQFKKIKKAHLKLSQNALELNQKNIEIAELRKKRDYQREVVYNELKTKLDDLFENKKFYLKKELTLTKTARILKTNTSYLSGLINKYYDCNFNQFVNKYRIQNACELLNKRNMDIYSIEGIADMVGFKSKSVFNQVFKEGTGVHPSVFRNATIVVG